MVRLLCILCVSVVQLFAQGDSTTFIEANTPLTLRINGQSAAVMTYSSPGNETITLTARALGGESEAVFDTIIELASPDGTRLAYNDDLTASVEGLSATDSQITHFFLAEPGAYTIRVNSFNGVTEGEVEITLTLVDAVHFVEETADNVRLLRMDLGDDQRFVHTFEAAEGETLHITARDPRGFLDPIITIYDADGAEIVINDDNAAPFALAGLTLNTFDAQIRDFRVPADGQLTLELREFLGRAGQLELRITSTSAD